MVDPTSTYSFSHPFSIASGLAGASVAGNTLALRDDADFGFYNGVLYFPGTFSSLSVAASAPFASGQIVTFAADVAVAEPSAPILLSAAIGVLALTPRRSGQSIRARH